MAYFPRFYNICYTRVIINFSEQANFELINATNFKNLAKINLKWSKNIFIDHFKMGVWPELVIDVQTWQKRPETDFKHTF